MLKSDHPKLPRAILALGFVSLFMDISSEMIHALLPAFLVTGLGASMVTVGLIEGLGEAMAATAKLVSGWLSDRVGRRKPFAVFGYALGALSKPLFALAPGVSWVLVARVTDRFGKGIRGAPRDALVADLAPAGLRGAAYGLRQSLDTVGAFTGPLLAIALMALSANDFRLVFWLALLPGLLAVAILTFGVREPRRSASMASVAAPIRRNELRQLGSGFWMVVALATVLTLARFSEAFLILRTQDLGLSLALLPAALILMNLVYAATAYPLGRLSDRLDRRYLLVGGHVVLILADVLLAMATDLWGAMTGIALWGLHMGMTQGLFAVLIADAAPLALRGTAFGLFHLTTGVAVLAASLIAGALWQWWGPAATFAAGAVFTTVSLIGVVLLIFKQPAGNNPG